MGADRDSDPEREREHELIIEIGDLQAELDVLGSPSVAAAIDQLYMSMNRYYDPTAAHEEHQDAVLLALGEEAERVIATIRAEVQSGRTSGLSLLKPRRWWRNR
jgi:hypothetical protein